MLGFGLESVTEGKFWHHYGRNIMTARSCKSCYTAPHLDKLPFKITTSKQLHECFFLNSTGSSNLNSKLKALLLQSPNDELNYTWDR